MPHTPAHLRTTIPYRRPSPNQASSTKSPPSHRTTMTIASPSRASTSAFFYTVEPGLAHPQCRRCMPVNQDHRALALFTS
ncbi:hypothetical protein U1Q18_036677, partial [Sarracenia purpurea var. burkii]